MFSVFQLSLIFRQSNLLDLPMQFRSNESNGVCVSLYGAKVVLDEKLHFVNPFTSIEREVKIPISK